MLLISAQSVPCGPYVALTQANGEPWGNAVPETGQGYQGTARTQIARMMLEAIDRPDASRTRLAAGA